MHSEHRRGELFGVAVDLTKQIAPYGEGAHSLIEVHVHAARDSSQTKRVAKAIVNSPPAARSNSTCATTSSWCANATTAQPANADSPSASGAVAMSTDEIMALTRGD